jgi:hypothetical protein
MHAVPLVMVGLLLSFFPAQTRQVSRVTMERHDNACLGLDEAQCCAQMLEIAGFRATGDQLPKATKTPVRLSCETPEKVFPETSCQLLMLGRGFDAKSARDICAPGTLAKRCQGDGTCKQCVQDLDKLSWRSSHRVCYALTYVERAVPRERSKVVTVTRGKNGNSADAQVVRVRRTELR